MSLILKQGMTQLSQENELSVTGIVILRALLMDLRSSSHSVESQHKPTDD